MIVDGILVPTRDHKWRWRTEVHNIDARIAARDLDMSVLGPGTQDPDPTPDWLTRASTGMASELGGNDRHVYPTATGAIASNTGATTTASQISTIDANDTTDKPFVVEELGDKSDWTRRMTPSHESQLSDLDVKPGLILPTTARRLSPLIGSSGERATARRRHRVITRRDR